MKTEASKSAGRCLWMVCFKTDPSSYQTYWNVHAADSADEATRMDEEARREFRRRNGWEPPFHHLWTVPYNAAGKTVEQTYADHLAATGSAQ